MFDELKFKNADMLPEYVFSKVAMLKMEQIQAGKDVIDLSMGNPDGKTPQFIIDKLCSCANEAKSLGYSISEGVLELREALCGWYMRKYGVSLDAKSEVVACMGSKEGFVNLARAVLSEGESVVVPVPAYPIHVQAFKLVGAKVLSFPVVYDEDFILDEDRFFKALELCFEKEKPKFVVTNFPHNPTTAVASKAFFQRLVDLAKKKRFYIIQDLAYAELNFDDYEIPSILEIKGAKDVAVETYTLSKTYNMAGWRVGFVAGNAKIIAALKKVKTWVDYGMFYPIQAAATTALNADQSCVRELKSLYAKRLDFTIKAFHEAGWELKRPKASMFIYSAIPPVFSHLSSMDFVELLIKEAGLALSPGIGFGQAGEHFVRIALIENEERTIKAANAYKALARKYS